MIWFDVFLSKISHIFWSNHENCKNRRFEARHPNMWKTNYIKYLSYFSEFFSLKLAVLVFTKSMFPKIKGWIDDICLSKIILKVWKKFRCGARSINNMGKIQNFLYFQNFHKFEMWGCRARHMWKIIFSHPKFPIFSKFCKKS